MSVDLRGTYDANDKPDEGFTIVPNGTYWVKIKSGEWKTVKDKPNSKYLQINMEIVDGEYKDSVLVERLNLINPNDTAVRIARGQFAALREAVGVREPKDLVDLTGIRFQVNVRCVKRSDDPTKNTNEIAKYIKKGETPTTPQQNDGNAPWSRNAPPPTQQPPAAGNSEVPF